MFLRASCHRPKRSALTYEPHDVLWWHFLIWRYVFIYYSFLVLIFLLFPLILYSADPSFSSCILLFMFFPHSLFTSSWNNSFYPNSSISRFIFPSLFLSTCPLSLLPSHFTYCFLSLLISLLIPHFPSSSGEKKYIWSIITALAILTMAAVCSLILLCLNNATKKTKRTPHKTQGIQLHPIHPASPPATPSITLRRRNHGIAEVMSHPNPRPQVHTPYRGRRDNGVPLAGHPVPVDMSHPVLTSHDSINSLYGEIDFRNMVL